MLRRFAVLIFVLLAPALFAQTFKPELFSGMKWRGIGPYRGGRVLAVTGVPSDPGVYYFGGVAGGVTDRNPPWPLSRPPQMLESSLPGVFAVGDVRAGSVKRVAAAVGEGSTSVSMVHRALAEH
ncbi:MAG: hypothetical protein WBV36_21690 [Terriglobales bacterium]